MTDADTEPAWMHPGATVIVASTGWNGDDLHKVQVAKLTKTQIVTDGGYRFSRRDLHQTGGGAWNTQRILDGDDPQTEVAWLEALQRSLRWNLQQQVEKLLSEFIAKGDTAAPQKAADVIADAIVRHTDRAGSIAALRAEMPATTEEDDAVTAATGTIEIDMDRAVELLEAAGAERGAGFVYRDAYPGAHCIYAGRFGDGDGPARPMCLIGAALAIAGVAPDVLAVLGGEVADIAGYFADYGADDGPTDPATWARLELTPAAAVRDEMPRLTPDAVRVWTAAQYAQDKGKTWGAALDMARRVAGVIRGRAGR